MSPFITSLLAAGVPLSFAASALTVSARAPFRWARPAVDLTVALSLGVLFATAGGVAGPSPAAVLRLDVVTGVMLWVVCVLAMVIVRYSQTCLQGDPGLARYARALLATLSAVSTLVLANDLVIIAAAWTATSFGVHQLLTFYPDRPQALVAAHKKFLLSRLADLLVLAALVLIGTSVGSLNLDVLAAWANANPALSPAVQAAAVLLVLAVALKSAQLPFHGWLTQVMEAPTPVSALLHAGVVNIGGFVMIRLSALMVHAAVAQLLLVLIGMTTVVVAGLVMTTRVSIKVALAWSTCAQMGFMLVQCGLGLWHLALLHLAAHSFYKAHAFLSSGTTVEAFRAQSLRPARRASVGALVAAWALGAVGIGVLLFLLAAAGAPVAGTSSALALTLFLALALAPLLAQGLGQGWRVGWGVVLRGAVVAALSVTLHGVAGRLLAVPSAPTTSTDVLAWLLAGAGLVLLFGSQVALRAWPDSALARAVKPRLFAGLYLDELFTRLTFRLWPVRRSEKAQAPVALRTTIGARS